MNSSWLYVRSMPQPCILDHEPLQPPTSTLDSSSPLFPPFPFPCPIKPNCNSISAAERDILDEAKARLVSPLHFRSIEKILVLFSPNRFYPRIHSLYQQCSVMLRDALERKKVAVLLLASTQSDIKMHSSWMIEEESLNKTIHFNHPYYNIGDH